MFGTAYRVSYLQKPLSSYFRAGHPLRDSAVRLLYI